MWDGHSCPSLLTLTFAAETSGQVSVNVKFKFQVKGDGQECPSHTKARLGRSTVTNQSQHL